MNLYLQLSPRWSFPPLGVKTLGVILDNTLSFQSHINNVTHSAHFHLHLHPSLHPSPNSTEAAPLASYQSLYIVYKILLLTLKVDKIAPQYLANLLHINTPRVGPLRSSSSASSPYYLLV